MRPSFIVTCALVPALTFGGCGPENPPVVSGSGVAKATVSATSAPPPASASVAASASAATLASAAPLVEPDKPTGDDAARDAELAKDATDIYDAFYDQSPLISPDGTKVVFKSNRDGIPTLYVADPNKGDSKVTRLVPSNERVSDFFYVDGGKSILFLSDKSADENWSYFKVGLDGTGLTELTPGETLHRDRPFVPRDASGTLVYSARTSSENKARIFTQPLAGGPAKLVYTDPGTSFLVDVSADGKTGVLLRLASLSDAKIVLVDLVSGAVRPLYPAEGKTAMIHDVAYGSDGTLYVATDGGGEEALLLAIDPATGAEKARYVEKNPATAQIGHVVAPKVKGDRIAIEVNAGNHTEVRLLDAKTLELKANVGMPLGTGGGYSMSDEGRLLNLHWSTPDAPPEIYAVDAKIGKGQVLRKDPRPSLAKLPKVKATIVEVPSFDGTKIPLNLYLPAQLPKGKKLPTLVIVHGGPASSYPIRWSVMNRYFTGHGFAVIEPNVRGSTGFGRKYEQLDDYKLRMDAVKDIEEVGKWAAKLAYTDADRLVIFGGS
jgi:dipeptidyl aminopeptidase/acylaminoacyl peptidase